ncbi:MAG: hypothetical protein DI536_01955 [Archangium gephyra]|uniref:Uncharacterized protein n=1 Tax=Archangium gephyra TaxID=48 RepID=A0A2W5VB35_9BACT|nr:MAG: hypothetical protein DI536_01955 [Archangium gephyra]
MAHTKPSPPQSASFVQLYDSESLKVTLHANPPIIESKATKSGEPRSERRARMKAAKVVDVR